MSVIRMMKHVIILIFIGVMLGGCAKPILPDRFASTFEAYPDANSLKPPKDKTDVYETALIMAAYADVYRAALISATQLQLNVTQDDETKGNIFAVKIVQSAPTVSKSDGIGGYNQRRYHYAIVIKELAAKKTRVTIMAKAQGACQAVHGFTHFLTAGISLMIEDDEDRCNKYSTVHWADGFDNTKAELSQYITFVRNNLISAGLY